MIIYKTSTFDAAHRLKGHNHCGNIHGHTWKVEVWVEGKNYIGLDLGMLFDFRMLTEIIQQFDHRCMLAFDDIEDISNETEYSELPYAPSAENLVHWFLTSLVTSLVQEHVNWTKIRCRVWESETSYAEDEIFGEKEKEGITWQKAQDKVKLKRQ